MSKIVGKILAGMWTLNLASMSLWREPIKMVEFLRKMYTIYLSYSIDPIQRTQLSKLLTQFESSEVLVPFHHIRPGSMPPADIVALAAICRDKHPKSLFEIGTFEGLSAVVFAANTDPSARVYTLDLPSGKGEGERTMRSWEAQSVTGGYRSGYLIDAFHCNGKINRLFGDSALFNFERYRDQIDLFLIDGAHTEDYVARDTLNAFNCISREGVIIWHDCFVPEVLAVLKKVARYHRISHIEDTNLAIAIGKPPAGFPWDILQRDIR